MTRAIKFRAWDGERMWFDVQKAYDHISGDESNNDEAIPLTSFEQVLSDWDVMQFTGLLDKNGKQIYEGDIVLLPDSETVPVTDEGHGPIEEMNHLSLVEFSEGCFGLRVFETSGVFHRGFWSFDSILNGEGYELKDLEIIGNIYENPELLTN